MAFTAPTKRTDRPQPDRKEKHRRVVANAAARDRDLALALSGENIVFDGDGMPEPADPKRKASAAKSIEVFAQTYLSKVFHLPMSEGQQIDFATMQNCITEGGRYAFAAPRGDGKTSRVEAALLWAALYNFRKCIVIVGADLAAAQDILESVKSELRTNELLRQDFPVPCWAAALADDTALKAKGWSWRGQHLGMKWSKSQIVLPIHEKADGAGCVIVPRGLTGRLRGMRIKVGAKAVRPDLYAIDDPQTDESAGSEAQIETREKLILGAIMGSGGPGESTAAFMPCTVINHGDLAARFLDRKRHPDWQGSARGLVTKWPDAQKTLWAEYHELRKFRSPADATAFYRSNRTAMDKGAILDWSHRFIEDQELSALQHAENLLCDLGEQVFYAEYQNDPRELQATVYDLTADHVAKRTNGLPRRTAPQNAVGVVGMVDINRDGLRWALAAVSNERALSILDYGIYPGQATPLIRENEAEAVALQRGLNGLDDALRGVEIDRGGQRLPINLMLVDCGGTWMQVIFDFVNSIRRRSPIPWMPSRGWSSKYYRPGRNTIGRPGDGVHTAAWDGKGQVIVHNSDLWRMRMQKGFLLPIGAPDSISLYGDASATHEIFAKQITAERLIAHIETDAGPFYKWVMQPNSRNDFGDVAVGLFAAASKLGFTPTGPRPRPARYVERRKPKVAFAGL